MACPRTRAPDTESGQPTTSFCFGKTTAASRRSSSIHRTRRRRACGDPLLGDASVLRSLAGTGRSARARFDQPVPPRAATCDQLAALPPGVRGGSCLRREGPAPRNEIQEETALFFSDIAIGPIQAALRDLAMRRARHQRQSTPLRGGGHDLADTSFAVWDAKYYYGWWRPITAIREADTDGNPDTIGDSDWTPLLVTALSGLAKRPERDHRCHQHCSHAGGRRG